MRRPSFSREKGGFYLMTTTQQLEDHIICELFKRRKLITSPTDAALLPGLVAHLHGWRPRGILPARSFLHLRKLFPSNMEKPSLLKRGTAFLCDYTPIRARLAVVDWHLRGSVRNRTVLRLSYGERDCNIFDLIGLLDSAKDASNHQELRPHSPSMCRRI